jgi:hypothetical protein
VPSQPSVEFKQAAITEVTKKMQDMDDAEFREFYPKLDAFMKDGQVSVKALTHPTTAVRRGRPKAKNIKKREDRSPSVVFEKEQPRKRR